MSRRDLHWRLAGVPFFGAAAALGIAANTSTAAAGTAGGGIGVLAFLLYMAGTVLVIQGERLPQAWLSRRQRRARPVVKPYSRSKREGIRRVRQ